MYYRHAHLYPLAFQFNKENIDKLKKLFYRLYSCRPRRRCQIEVLIECSAFKLDLDLTPSPRSLELDTERNVMLQVRDSDI